MAAEGTLVERAVDSVIGLFSPRAAKVRRHHRRMLRDEDYASAFHLVARMRGYKHAEKGTNKTPWLNESNRTGDGEIVPSLPSLRNRSRAATRDDSIGAGLLLQTFPNNVVGTGLRPQARCVLQDGQPDASKNEALELVWRDRCGKLCPADGDLPHGEHQRLVYTRRNEDGDVLLRGVMTSADEPVWIETVEGSRISTPSNAKPRDPEGRIVNGVERDRYSRVVAYWVRKSDPGDTGLVDTVGKLPNPSTSVENYERVARGPMVCFYRNGVTRAGQSRGVPKLHACLQDVLDLDLLFLAALKRTQLAACLALFITSGEDATDLIELTAEDYGYQLDQKIEPGMVFRLFPGEKVETIEPNLPFADLNPLFMIAARRIGASVGISPQAVLRIWEGINYSGARTILLDDRLTYRCERQSLDDQVLDWEWELVQSDALLRRDPRLVAAGVTASDISAHYVKWIANGEGWVDPTSDAAATEKMLELGLATYQDECSKQGKDWRENVRARIERERYESQLRDSFSEEADDLDVDAIQSVLVDVSTGVLPADSAIALLAFSGVTPDMAEAMVRPAADAAEAAKKKAEENAKKLEQQMAGGPVDLAPDSDDEDEDEDEDEPQADDDQRGAFGAASRNGRLVGVR